MSRIEETFTNQIRNSISKEFETIFNNQIIHQPEVYHNHISYEEIFIISQEEKTMKLRNLNIDLLESDEDDSLNKTKILKEIKEIELLKVKDNEHFRIILLVR